MDCILTGVNILLILILLWLATQLVSAERFAAGPETNGGKFLSVTDAKAKRTSGFAAGDQVLVLWSSGCPHCINFMGPGGEWGKFTPLAGQYGINAHSIQIDAPTMSSTDQTILHTVPQQLLAQGVPCILKASPGGTWSRYNGQRDRDSLIAWAKQ